MKKYSFGSLIVIILLLIATTILEKIYGTPWVATYIYGSTWFLLLWVILTISATIYIFQRKLYKHFATLMLHLSFVVILLGATITHYFGIQGQIHLRVSEEPKNIFTDIYYQEKQLPFAIQLTNFELIHYPGTTNPMDYVSRVHITDNKVQIADEISMNNILKYQGYRFYQSSYDADLKGSILSVYYDPYGITVTYIGYFMLFASMTLFLIKKRLEI